jgi:hypothetical protein
MKITTWGLGLASLAALLLSVSDADALLFHHHCHCRHHCCDMRICCRPYNAFTPFCCGTMHCDGCCPLPCAQASGCAAMPSYGCDMPAPVCGGFAGACAPGYGSPAMGGSMPVNLPPAMPMPSGVPVPLNPNVPPVLNHTAQYANPAMYYGVQPVGYYPGYYYGYQPSYYPAAYYYQAAYQNGYNPYYGYGYGYAPRAY